MSDITYFLNDPTTPNMTIPVDLPQQPNVLNFKVNGFIGATNTTFTLEHQAAMCYYGIIHAINVMNRYAKTPVTAWSSVPSLFVEPRAGKQLNAYYDRQALRFFYAMDPVQRNMVYACNSADVVLHETGHAILDAFRPDLFNVQSYEVWGFHESFGDIHAIINTLQYDEMIDEMLTQTNGDIRQSNVVTMLAEEMGRAIYNMTGGRNGYSAGCLRNAVNNFTYVPPETLPRDGMDTQLTSEPHNFSRVFTGTWWDLLCAIYEANRKIGQDQRTALISARDVLTSYTFNAIPNAPATIRFYDAFAKALLLQDKLNDYQFNTIMNDVFIKRNILRAPVRPMASLNWMAFKNMIDPNDQVIEHPKASMVRSKNIEQFTLPDHMLNVEVPNDSYYEFNGTGDCVEFISTSPVELIDHARNCVDFLKQKGMIRPDRSTPFEITDDGRLIRSHFAGCFLNNATDPNQPEFLKGWKPENNAGCGCSSKKVQTCNSSKRSVITQANTRLNATGCGFSTISSGQNVNFGFPGGATSKASC